MPRLTKLVLFWAFVSAAALLVLQVIPNTGIFLMFLQAALVTGVLIHVFLISLLVEAWFHRVPRYLMIVPLAAYGAYYAAYSYQAFGIARTSAMLRASNPGKVLDFDPSVHSLVTKDANGLVQRYAIPVVYEVNANFKPEGHLSHRLIRRDQCGLKKDSQNRIQTFGMHFGNRFVQAVCVLHFPEKPPFKIVTAIRRGDDEIWKRKWDISEQVTDIVVDGAIVGTYRSASVWRLPLLPMGVVGCGLISSTPAWKCGADFKRTYTVIDTVPAGVDSASYDTPLSVMLGLKKYTEADLTGFRGYEINDAALARVAGEPERVEEDVFKALEAILNGQNPKPPFNIGFSLSRNPERLVPYADRMAARFVQFHRGSPQWFPNYDDQTHGLATALVSLPRAAFLSVADQINGVFEREELHNRYSALYVRTGDAGVKTLARYKNDFMSGKVRGFLRPLPVLAICRIGQADEETIAEMKRQIVDSGGSRPDDEDYKSALFISLMKLGQEAFLRENFESVSSPRMRDWANAVLAGKGATDTGPNNCMAMRWNNTNYTGPMMVPGLVLQRGAWTSQVRTN